MSFDIFTYIISPSSESAFSCSRIIYSNAMFKRINHKHGYSNVHTYVIPSANCQVLSVNFFPKLFCIHIYVLFHKRSCLCYKYNRFLLKVYNIYLVAWITSWLVCTIFSLFLFLAAWNRLFSLMFRGKKRSALIHACTYSSSGRLCLVYS